MSRTATTPPPPPRLRVATALAAAALAVGLALTLGVGHPSQYLFTPAAMQAAAVASLAEVAAASPTNTTTAADMPAIADALVRRLRSAYGDHILPSPPWVLNAAGGAIGAMLVLHCSLSEYVILFGTPLGTRGFTGRFAADDYFTILAGEQTAFRPGAWTAEVYRPGEMHHLARGDAKVYALSPGGWALEYARGNIVSMLPFGAADGVWSTLDWVGLWGMVRVSAVGIVRELLKGKV